MVGLVGLATLLLEVMEEASAMGDFGMGDLVERPYCCGSCSLLAIQLPEETAFGGIDLDAGLRTC